MSCDRYYELLSARMDRELTREEAEELELHLAGCPRCRIVGEQMEEAREAFANLEEVPAPEGFAQGVMDRIRAGESRPKVIPLFKRPQFKALAGLAACLVLAVGLYGTVQSQKMGEESMLRSVAWDAQPEDAPMISAYSNGSEPIEETVEGLMPGTQKAAPEADAYAGAAVGDPGHYAFWNDQYIRLDTYFYDVPEPAARIVGSAQSLDELLALFSDDFSQLYDQYDEKYFRTNRLLAVIVGAPSGSLRYQIADQGLMRYQVTVQELLEPGRDMTCDLAWWLILAEVDSMFDDGDELALNLISQAEDTPETKD